MESELSKKQIEQQEVMGREGAFCKYNEETERCIYNPDANAVANDEKCYKTEKNRCASKNKMRKIKIKPKKAKELQQQQQEELVEEAQQSPATATAEEAFCKYNEATKRCVYNPDPNASANDEKCYKTEKNRCASKKKKMMKIKIKPKKVKGNTVEEIITDKIEEVLPPVKKKIKIVPTENKGNKKINNDFLYPDLNDENFNIKISEKKEFYDTMNTEKIYRNKELIEHADKMCNATYELQQHQYFVKNFMSFQTPYNSLLLYHGLGSGKTCSAIGISENMRDYLNQMGIKQEIVVISSINVKNNFKKELFDVSKLHRNESGKWTISGCTGNKYLKEINLQLFDIDNEVGNPLEEEKIKLKIKKQIDKIIKKSYLFFGYQKFSSIIKMLISGEGIIQKSKLVKKGAEGEEGKGEEEDEGEGEAEEDEDR